MDWIIGVAGFFVPVNESIRKHLNLGYWNLPKYQGCYMAGYGGSSSRIWSRKAIEQED